MKSRIVRIGNSKGLRLPKSLLEQTGIDGDVEIVAEGNTLRIRKAKTRKKPRQGWAESFQEMAKHGDDKLIDGDWPATQFDEEEWKWR